MKKLVEEKKMFAMELNNAKKLTKKKIWVTDSYSHKLKEKEESERCDIESKKQRRLQEQRRERILSKLEKSSHTGGIRVLCRPFISKQWRR